jgi:ribosome-associated protein
MAKQESRRSAAEAIGDLPVALRSAIEAAQSKKAAHVKVLDLRKAEAFTDFFLLCSGQSTRQVQAIADAIEEALRKDHVRPAHIEGYDRAEWILLDYFDFVVHIFIPATREFYSLERLWGSAREIDVPDESGAGAARAR